ncbi:MAG: glycosyltransferase family 4 protein [Muribaculaceae bacterium]|nr:glycosyltransferase family 4 protein [Muribaculaceae bacterium]
MSKSMQKQISVIEIDSRDVRYQSGIATYFNVLRDGMPENISTYNIVFYRSPEFKDVRITDTDDELQIFHPVNYPFHTLFDAVIAMIWPKIKSMPNLIVKSDCLSCEGLAYMIKSRIYCKTIGVLHCQPQINSASGFVPADPYFNMDYIILVGDNGRRYIDYWKCARPFSVIYNGVEKPKLKSKHPNDGVFRFIFANGWSPHKGFEKIIPVIRRIAKKHKIEVYVLGGWMRETEALFEEIADLPIIRVGLLDNVDEIARYYEMADCALFASRTEACSFAGIEAMAYSLPIVSTNENAMVEMFGAAALYADMTANHEINLNQYERHMLRIIENRAVRIKQGAIGYSRFISRYTRKRMLDDTIKIYRSLVE